MERKRGGIAGVWDRNKSWARPLANYVSFVQRGPLGAYNMNLLTKKGGGLKATVNDPLWQAQAATLAGGLAAGAGGAGAAGAAGAGAEAAGTEAAGGKKKSAVDKAKELFGLVNTKTGGKLGSSELLGGIAKGLYDERKTTRELELEREKLAQAQRQFDATFGLKTRETDILAAQEADRKRREDELMAARASLRAMFGGS
jgi:hypothetical protein